MTNLRINNCHFKEKTQELLEAPTSCQEVKDTASAWLKTVRTKDEADATKHYITELAADIMPVDDLIQFAGSDTGIQYFG